MLTPHLVQELRKERARLLEAVGTIDQLLTQHGGVAPGPERERHDVPTGHPPGRRTRYDWARGQQLYEQGSSDAAVAKELGCTVQAVKGRRINFGWSRPGSGPKTPVEQATGALVQLGHTPAAARKAIEKIGPTTDMDTQTIVRRALAKQDTIEGGNAVSCPNCNHRTSVSPCSNCNVELPAIMRGQAA